MRLHLPFTRTSILLLILTVSASAQWVEEQYPLKAGFNAIWLSIDCSEQAIEDLLPPSTNVEEVWQWNASASATRFTQTPAAPDQPDAQWKVWRRDPTGHPASTLGLLTPNAAYLVKVADGTSPFQLALTGKPAPPDYRWKSSGVNFVGFPSVPATPPTFTNFLSFSEVLKNAPPVFFYNGGELTLNPRRLVTPNTKPVVRGHAYWVQTSDYTDFYGPLQVTVLRGGGLDYGRKLTSATVRVKNASDPAKNQTVTATIALVPSAPAPGGGVPQQVALRLRGPRDAGLQFTYTDLPTTITLAPGEERDLVLDADRTQMSVPDEFHAGILQVSDSLGHTRIDLPVSATGSSRNGVWIGAAVLDSVNQVETIRGPEFDAPVGTPDGESAETTSEVITTKTTVGGQTTGTTIFRSDFDENGLVPLPGSGFSAANVTVTGPDGSPEFVAGTDFEVIASSPARATVTNGGSGYSEAPAVTFISGGGNGATATATLSGAVRRVTITEGGSGYTAAPEVTFIGGGGSGAVGTATIADGLVTDVTITNGGSGYSSPPTIEFTGEHTSPAAATATIAGSVGSVIITGGGSGYAAPPKVVFSAVDGDETGGGAGATVYVTDSGFVTGFDVIRKLEEGTIGGAARIAASTVTAAPVGTPDGSLTSTVTSISKLVTLNGKSHLRTRRVSSGEGAAAPSNFPVRLILHAPPSGAPTLLQQVYLGQRDGEAYAGPEEESLATLVKGPLTKLNGEGETVPVPPGNLGRASSASFPRGEFWAGSGSLGDSASFTVTLGHDAETNPFLHTYHPDHDNWDARFESPLPAGNESYTVTRDITFTFSPTPLPGVSDLSWGVTTLGGTYRETISGLRSQEIAISGNFILHQVSEVPTLTTPQP